MEVIISVSIGSVTSLICKGGQIEISANGNTFKITANSATLEFNAGESPEFHAHGGETTVKIDGETITTIFSYSELFFRLKNDASIMLDDGSSINLMKNSSITIKKDESKDDYGNPISCDSFASNWVDEYDQFK